MENCLFCKIAKKEIPSLIVYEDDYSLGFLDIHPLSKGHVLVIPKEHAENILDLRDELVGKLFKSVKDITAGLNIAFEPKGFTIGINHGRISGQAVDHLHIHIIPRYEGDKGGSVHSIVNNPPVESPDEVRPKIIEALKGTKHK